MSRTISTSPGSVTQLPLHSLRLDPENPRVPENHRGKDNLELAQLLEMGFDAYAVAQSIADLGYFSAEPLIVVPSATHSDAWIVVEGNRRLTALLGLASPEIRAGFSAPDRWDALASKRSIRLEDEVPVVVHETRDTTHAEIARIHVVGKLGWRPLMQARYIAARVDEGRTIAEVADLIGVTKSKAADLYRDQAVLRQAERFGLETSQVEAAFSLLTVAMSSTKIRDHVGAPLGSQLKPGQDPIPTAKADELSEVITWIFGDEERESLISDSRQIAQLGNVVASDVGLAALRGGKSLEEAKQTVASAGLDPLVSLVKRLTTARSALSSASNDITEFARDAEVRHLLDDIESLLVSIRSGQQEIDEDADGD